MTAIWNEKRQRYEAYDSREGDMVEAGGRSPWHGGVSYPGYTRMSPEDEARAAALCGCCHSNPCGCDETCGVPQPLPITVDDGIDRTSETPPDYEPPREAVPRRDLRPSSPRPRRPRFL